MRVGVSMKIAVLSDIHGNGIALNWVIDIILCGHSHCSFIGEVQGKKIFNTGSIGNSLDGDNRASYGILDFSNGNVQLINSRISYPTAELIEIAEKNNFPNFSEYKNIIMNASMN